MSLNPEPPTRPRFLQRRARCMRAMHLLHVEHEGSMFQGIGSRPITSTVSGSSLNKENDLLARWEWNLPVHVAVNSHLAPGIERAAWFIFYKTKMIISPIYMSIWTFSGTGSSALGHINTPHTFPNNEALGMILLWFPSVWLCAIHRLSTFGWTIPVMLKVFITPVLCAMSTC